jgi:hypothetical protein
MTALQERLDIAAETGGVAQMPPGNLRPSELPLRVADGVTVQGAGRGNFTRGDHGTLIETDSALEDIFIVEGDSACFRDLWIRGTANTPRAGCAIRLATGTFASLERCRIEGTYNGLETDDAYFWGISKCHFAGLTNYGILVRNRAIPDFGDDSVNDCTFTMGDGGAAAIRYESGGGLRVENNKLLGYDLGVDLALDAVSTVDLLIVGNSIENQLHGCVRLGALGHFENVVISANQMAAPRATGPIVEVNGGVDKASITGNLIAGPHVGVDVHTSAVSIESNQFHDAEVGIRLNRGAGAFHVGPNHFYSVAAPVQDDTDIGAAPGLVEHRYRRKVPNVGTEFVELYRFDMQPYRAARLKLTADLLLGGVGSTVRVLEQTLRRDTGPVNVTTISDHTDGPPFDLRLDTTTTPGSVTVSVRKTARGTDLVGSLTAELDGHVQKVRLT